MDPYHVRFELASSTAANGPRRKSFGRIATPRRVGPRRAFSRGIHSPTRYFLSCRIFPNYFTRSPLHRTRLIIVHHRSIDHIGSFIIYLQAKLFLLSAGIHSNHNNYREKILIDFRLAFTTIEISFV